MTKTLKEITIMQALEYEEQQLRYLKVVEIASSRKRAQEISRWHLPTSTSTPSLLECRNGIFCIANPKLKCL
jgi:hypothetical protein